MSVGELGDVAERWRPQGACTVFACDIASFGDAARTDDVRTQMRDALYQGLDASLRTIGIGLDGCYHEDRGDGAMVLVPPTVGTDALLTSVVDMLKAELRRYNKAASDVARLKLRVAVHTGEARHDGNGVVGTAVNHTFRILDAQAFKDVLDESGALLAVTVSQRVYEDVVQHGFGLVDPDEYRRIDVAVKETEGAAWVRVPGAARPPMAPTGAEVAERTFAPPEGGEPPGPDAMAPGAVFEVVDRMIEVPLMASEPGREQVLSLLRGEVSGAVPRHSAARMDIYSIITTCLDYPGGLQELLTAVKGLSGESMSVLRLEQTIARVLPRL